MFQRVQTTRRRTPNGNLSRRNKRIHNQKGGGKIDIYNKEAWTSNFPNIAEYIEYIDSDNTSSTPPESVVKGFILVLQQQNELFEFAVKQIAKDCGLKENYSHADVKEEFNGKTELLGHIYNVYKLVTAQYYPLPPIPGAPDTPTGKSFSITSLLLSPKRAENVFIDTLANLLIVCKNDPTITKMYATHKNYANECLDANIHDNAYFLTQTKLVDGFILRNPGGENNTYTQDIWNDLLSENDQSFADVTSITKFSQITHYLYNTYKSASKLEIFSLLSAPINSEEAHTDLPQHIVKMLDIKFENEHTLKNILSRVTFEQLQFILQLSYLIEKNEPGVLEEINSPKPSPSPS